MLHIHDRPWKLHRNEPQFLKLFSIFLRVRYFHNFFTYKNSSLPLLVSIDCSDENVTCLGGEGREVQNIEKLCPALTIFPVAFIRALCEYWSTNGGAWQRCKIMGDDSYTHRLPSSYPSATHSPQATQHIGYPPATHQLPSNYPLATLKISFSYPQATLQLPIGYPPATHRLPSSSPSSTLQLPTSYPLAVLKQPIRYTISTLQLPFCLALATLATGTNKLP